MLARECPFCALSAEHIVRHSDLCLAFRDGYPVSRSHTLVIPKRHVSSRMDTPTVILRDVPVAESDEEKPGVILDYDADGNIVSIEVLDASRRVEEPGTVTVSTET